MRRQEVDERLGEALINRSSSVSEGARLAALIEGDAVEPTLLWALQRAQGVQRVRIASALGSLSSTGPGDAALRGLLKETGPGSGDAGCAAVVAIARRCEGKATYALVEALSSKSSAVTEYALTALAAFGEESAWEPVVARLERRKLKPGAALAAAVDFLVRIAPHLPEPARLRLVGAIRRQWAAISDEATVSPLIALWPDLEPDGPSNPQIPPSIQRLSVNPWAASPIYGPDAQLRQWQKQHGQAPRPSS